MPKWKRSMAKGVRITLFYLRDSEMCVLFKVAKRITDRYVEELNLCPNPLGNGEICQLWHSDLCEILKKKNIAG